MKIKPDAYGIIKMCSDITTNPTFINFVGRNNIHNIQKLKIEFSGYSIINKDNKVSGFRLRDSLRIIKTKQQMRAILKHTKNQRILT